MITLHLFRHGETEWHHENRYAGWSDVALTDRGREQASRLAQWAEHRPVDLVVTSDLSRAVETGLTAARAANAPHRVDERLREVNFGRGEGRTRDEMRAIFPDELEAFLAAPASSPLPGGENGADASARGLAAIAELAASAGDGASVVIVAHSTLIRLVLCRLLGLPIDDYRRRFPELGNVAVTTVRIPPDTDAAALPGTAQLLCYNAPL
ncbi:histidine phosphatase family protein [Glaciibacter flavus]|uniref:histidine phosphatase family protein n=1 Tax=Orlajensenia flava TaxID=2565934 RepID=UPI003B00E4BB